MFSKKIFGQRIYELRKNAGETQTFLGELIGVKKGQISGIEKGNATTTAERIALFCEHYGVSADYLLGLTDDPEPKYGAQGAAEKGSFGKELSAEG